MNQKTASRRPGAYDAAETPLGQTGFIRPVGLAPKGRSASRWSASGDAHSLEEYVFPPEVPVAGDMKQTNNSQTRLMGLPYLLPD